MLSILLWWYHLMHAKKTGMILFFSADFIIDPFTIAVAYIHPGQLWVEKLWFRGENRDVINTFNCSTTSFYRRGYYYHSQMTRMNAGPQLSWKGLLWVSVHCIYETKLYDLKYENFCPVEKKHWNRICKFELF